MSSYEIGLKYDSDIAEYIRYEKVKTPIDEGGVESRTGAHYYAVSPFNREYNKASFEADLSVVDLNTMGNTRVGYISLGIKGTNKGIDVGIKNEGDGWYFYLGDLYAGSVPVKGSIVSNAKRVFIEAGTMIDSDSGQTRIDYNVVFYDSYGNPLETINNYHVPSSEIFVEWDDESGDEWAVRPDNGFCRFVSLVNRNTIVDDTNDGSYLQGPILENLKIYEHDVEKGWSINSNNVHSAWVAKPECAEFNYSNYDEEIMINHNISRVEDDKEWTITLSLDVDSQTVNSDTVYVMDYTSNEKQAVILNTYQNKIFVEAPSGGYNRGEMYTLYIELGLKSTSGQTLSTTVTKPFVII